MGIQEIVEGGTIFIYAILLLYVWGQGLYGMCAGKTIMAKYGCLISRGWGIVRIIRTFLNAMMFIMCLYTFGWIAGAYAQPFTFENVCWCLVTLGINLLVMNADKKRFQCDQKLARQIIRNERYYAFSIVTRISLIFTIVTMSAMYVMTDTSEYYRGKDGKIYRYKDMCGL